MAFVRHVCCIFHYTHESGIYSAVGEACLFNAVIASTSSHIGSEHRTEDLLSAPLVLVHHGSVIPPLQPPYNGPYVILRHGFHSFNI